MTAHARVLISESKPDVGSFAGETPEGNCAARGGYARLSVKTTDMLTQYNYLPLHRRLYHQPCMFGDIRSLAIRHFQMVRRTNKCYEPKDDAHMSPPSVPLHLQVPDACLFRREP